MGEHVLNNNCQFETAANTLIQFNTKMNIYTFKILMRHSMIIEEKNDPENELWTCFHISEMGPPNRPDLHKIRMIKELLIDIPHSLVTNYW